MPRPTSAKLADSYLESKRVIIAWCLGLTQHEHGVDTVREIVNLLLLRGNIGAMGAGPCPCAATATCRATVPAASTIARMRPFSTGSAEVCGIDPPRQHGMGTVETIEAMHRGDIKVFVALGGNFALAAPDLSYTAEALRKCELTVQVSTKLNRSHVVHGRRALILPCLARTEKDHQASGEQGVTVEDSMAMVHISYGMKEPASPQQRSECAILAGLAQATLPRIKHAVAGLRRRLRPDPRYDGARARWVRRCEPARPLPARLPAGQPARERIFKTPRAAPSSPRRSPTTRTRAKAGSC